MQYFVIGDDGIKYGPAEVLQLNSWIIEGRLTPTTRLEPAGGGPQVYASSVPGLNFPTTTPPSATSYQTRTDTSASYQTPNSFQTPASYPRGGAYRPQNTQNLTYAWISFAVGFMCCPIIANAFGMSYAKKAENEGIEGAKIAYWFNLGYIIFTVGIYGLAVLLGFAGALR